MIRRVFIENIVQGGIEGKVIEIDFIIIKNIIFGVNMVYIMINDVYGM